MANQDVKKLTPKAAVSPTPQDLTQEDLAQCTGGLKTLVAKCAANLVLCGTNLLKVKCAANLVKCAF